MAFTAQVLESGPRNHVVHVVGSGAEVAAVLVNLATLTPPTNHLRLNKIIYDVGAGGVFTISFGTDPVVSLTEGNGQKMCYNKVGGINDINGPSNAVFDFTGAATYTVTAHFIKKRSAYIP